MRRQLFVLVILSTCISSLAVAADKEDAKRLFESGLKLMKADDFSAAAANFERSAALYPTQTALFNLANCYKALQRYAEALEVLGRLHRDFGDKLKLEIQEAVGQQEAEIRSVVAALVVKVSPAGAGVVLDGREMSESSLAKPLLLAPGDHAIEASLPGYRSAHRSVRLVSGVERREEIVLLSESGYVLVRSEPAGATVVVDGKPKATTPLATPLALTPGSHTVTVRVSGRKEVERKVEIQSGETQVLDLSLPALNLTAPPVSPATVDTDSPFSASARMNALPSEAKAQTRFWKILAWSSSAAALAAGATALVFWKVLGDARFQDAKTYDSNYARTGSTKDKNDRQIAYDDAIRDGKIALGCGIGAGVLAATGLFAFVSDAGEARKAGTINVSVSPYGLGVRF
jgi:hypothetical protein